MEQRKYTDEERQIYEKDPIVHLEHRKALESAFNGMFSIFIANSELQQAVHANMTQTMKDALNNEKLENVIIPKWAVGCRRFTPGINYLETLGKENVDVVYGQVKEITENGCIGPDDQEYTLDVLICATGFDNSYRPRFPIIGQKGVNLADAWAKEATSYFGLAAADFPNYFMYIGPNSPVGNGPLLCYMGEYTSRGTL